MFELGGKRALVTGASRGAGRGIAKALADAGASVVVAASDEAAAITGSVITIDNGLTAGQYSFTGKFGLGVQFS